MARLELLHVENHLDRPRRADSLCSSRRAGEGAPTLARPPRSACSRRAGATSPRNPLSLSWSVAALFRASSSHRASCGRSGR